MNEHLFRKAFFSKITVKISFVILCLFVIAAITSSLIAPYDPAAISLTEKGMAPSLKHLFGTDLLGRDVLAECCMEQEFLLQSPWSAFALED